METVSYAEFQGSDPGAHATERDAHTKKLTPGGSGGIPGPAIPGGRGRLGSHGAAEIRRGNPQRTY